jgi:hypothetical protein
MEYEKGTETIIGCAYGVYNKIGFGFLESVYEIGEKKLKLSVRSWLRIK